MTDLTAHEARQDDPRLDDIRQMLDGPGDGWTQGEWCWAAGDLLKRLDMLSHRADWVHPDVHAEARALVEQIEAVCDDYSEGRIDDSLVALAKIGRLVYTAVPDPQEPRDA